MPHDSTDLARRLGLAKATDTIKGTVFRAVLSEIERHVAADDPRLAELRKSFAKRAWQEFSSFPIAEYLKLVYAAADLIEPKAGSPRQAMNQLGYSVTNAFLTSPIGKVATSIASGKKAVDVLSYAPGVYGVSASYGQRTFVRLSDHQAMLKIRGDFMPPDYHLGVIRCGLETFGHKVQLEVKTFGLLDADYTMTHLPS